MLTRVRFLVNVCFPKQSCHSEPNAAPESAAIPIPLRLALRAGLSTGSACAEFVPCLSLPRGAHTVLREAAIAL
jgi:hypothetical protein